MKPCFLVVVHLTINDGFGPQLIYINKWQDIQRLPWPIYHHFKYIWVQSKRKKISNNSENNYDQALARLANELVHLQERVKYQDLKVVINFEGLDTPGNGSTI